MDSFSRTSKVSATRIMSGMLGFKEKPCFTATQGANEAPKVRF